MHVHSLGWIVSFPSPCRSRTRSPTPSFRTTLTRAAASRSRPAAASAAAKVFPPDAKQPATEAASTRDPLLVRDDGGPFEEGHEGLDDEFARKGGEGGQVSGGQFGGWRVR